MTVSATDLTFIRDLVRTESAIVLDESKAYLIEARLSPLARAAGLESINQLVDTIRSGSRQARSDVVEAMTTNETSFFRDNRPFRALAKTVLPACAEMRGTTRTLRIWSGAASTGQEAYSIAMTVRDLDPMFAGWNVSILGTDIAKSVLAQAKEGRYAQLEVNRGLPATQLVKWFERQGTGWQANTDLRSMCKFEVMNLVARWPVSLGRFDIIFLRNVLIYFDVETKRKILEQVQKVLAPDGYLVLGTSELMNGVYDGFRSEPIEQTAWFRPL